MLSRLGPLVRMVKSALALPARRIAISFFKLAEYAFARSLALIGSVFPLDDIRLGLETGSAFEDRLRYELGRDLGSEPLVLVWTEVGCARLLLKWPPETTRWGPPFEVRLIACDRCIKLLLAMLPLVRFLER